MPDPVTIASIKHIAQELLKIAPWAWKQLPRNGPAAKAIRTTAENFSTRLPRFEDALEAWILSDSFRSQVEAIETGHAVDSDAAHADLFVRTTGFALTAISVESILEGLLCFYSELYLELCVGPQGMRTLGAKLDVIHHELLKQGQEQKGTEIHGLPYRPSIEADTSRRGITDNDRKAEVELDLIRSLVDNRQGETGLRLLATLQHRVDHGEISSGVRLRFYINRGVCYLLNRNWDAAERDFERAHTLEPANRKALINLAQVANCKGDYVKALQYAEAVLAQDPSDSHGNSLLLLNLHNLHRQQEIQDVLASKPDLADDAFCLYTLAYIAIENQRFDEAEHYLRRHNEKDSKRPEAWEMLGRALFAPSQRQLRETAPSTEWIPDPLRQRLEEAESYFTCAIELLGNSENHAELACTLGNRGAARTILGHYDNARRDYEHALQLDSSHVELKCNLGRLYLITNQLDKAEHLLKDSWLTSHHPDIAPILASTYLELKKPADARDVLESLGDPMLREDRLMILALLLLAYERLGAEQRSSEIVAQLAALGPDPGARRTLADHHARKGDLDEAIRLLRLAIAEAPEQHHARCRLALADLLYRVRRFADAVEEYDQVRMPPCESRECMRHLIALFSSGRFARALALTIAVRGVRPAVADFSEIEALVHERLGNLEEAVQIRRALLAEGLGTAHQKLKIAGTELRRGDPAAARVLALEVQLAEINDDPESLHDAAQLRALLDLPEALAFAYRLLQSDPNSPESHLFYVNTFFRREEIDQSLFHPREAGVDCLVTLIQGNRTRMVTIVHEGDDVSKDWLSASHPFAALMLGRRPGDKIMFPVDGPGSSEYTITDIRNKFVAAYQDCLDRFNERFPTIFGPTRVEVKPEDPIEMVLMLERRRAHADYALGLYKNGRTPACMLARLLGKEDAELFKIILEDPQIRVLSFDGTAEGSAREDADLSGAPLLLLEVSALVTLRLVNLLNAVREAFGTIYVTQHTVDSLHDITLNQFPERQAGSIFSDTPGHLQILSRSATAAKEEHDFYLSLLEYVRSSCEIIAPSALEEFELPEMEHALGSVAVSALAAARTLGAVLVSDDLPLKLIARDFHSISTGGSLGLLRQLQKRQAITDDDYHSAVRWLISRGCVFISVGKDSIIWIVRKNLWSPTAEVASAFQLLAGPDCDAQKAIGIGLEVMTELAGEPIPATTRQLLFDLLLKTLITGRNANLTLQLLASAHHRNTMLWTPASQHVQDAIRKFRHGGFR